RKVFRDRAEDKRKDRRRRRRRLSIVDDGDACQELRVRSIACRKSFSRGDAEPDEPQRKQALPGLRRARATPRQSGCAFFRELHEPCVSPRERTLVIQRTTKRTSRRAEEFAIFASIVKRY